MTLRVESRGGAVHFRVKVQAGARREGLCGVQDGVLRVRVRPPALEGRANQALIELLAECLRVPRSSVKIAGGERSSHNLVEVAGLDAAEVGERLRPEPAEDSSGALRS